MKVSIITVCYNADALLEKTIKSVLEQTFQNIEYIIIDGGSTDSTLKIIDKYRQEIDVVVSEKDNGIYDAMNKGIQQATGEWINFKNAGDRFISPSALEIFFSEPVKESVGIVHGDCLYENDWGYITVKPGSESSGHGIPVLHPSTFVRTSLHKQILFDTSFKSSGDFDFITRCRKLNVNFEYRPLTVCSFITGGFATQNRLLTFKEDCRILEKQNSISKWLEFIFLRFKVLTLNLLNRSKVGGLLYKKYLISKGWQIR